MIQYSLKCDNDHSFESWFQSVLAFDKLHGAGLLACSVCGSANVSKAIMAPRVSSGAAKANPLSQPATAAEQAIAELRKKVEENADYVGSGFPDEARAIHEGKVPERPIYGEANVSEARELIADGVPVAPLPFSPSRKTN